MKNAIAMLMICVTSLERVEGTDQSELLWPGSVYRFGSASPVAVYHGETMIIGSTTRNKRGQELFDYPNYSDPKMVWRYCASNTGLCATGGSKPASNIFQHMLNGVPRTGWIGSTTQYSTPLTTMGGLCIPFNHSGLLSEFVVQDPPIMPGYTICGKQTQLTVYLRECCENCIHYKTIGHCDNSTLALTQCLTIKSAFTDTVHAVTSHYRLTPCNFNASTVPGRKDGPMKSAYRGPMGTEHSKKGQVRGSDIMERRVKKWQTKVLGNNGNR